MKFLIVLFLFPLAGKAQMNVLMHGQPQAATTQLKDSVQLQLDPGFQYAGLSETVDNEYLFTNASNNLIKLGVGIKNDAIERVQITGRYEDLFPIWKKYINQNADVVETKKESQKVVVQDLANKKTIVIQFEKGKLWWIHQNIYPIK